MATASQFRSQIRERMKVVGADGEHIGTVDRIEGDRIKLTKSDPASGGEHHFLDLKDVTAVNGNEVHISHEAHGGHGAHQGSPEAHAQGAKGSHGKGRPM